MDSNDVHRHKHRHMHTPHFRYMARICMFRCMFRIVCLDEWLGFILRKNQFSKKYEQNHSNHFLNKPWDSKSHCIFSFHFLNQISMKINHTWPLLQITNPTSHFLNLMPLRPLSILQNPIFKLKINQQKQKHFWKRTTVDLIP